MPSPIMRWSLWVYALGIALFRDQLYEISGKLNLALFSVSQTALRAIHSPIKPTSRQSLIRFIKNQAEKVEGKRTHLPISLPSFLRATWKAPKKAQAAAISSTSIGTLSAERPLAPIQKVDHQTKVKIEKLRVNLSSVNSLLDDPGVFPYLAQFVLDMGRFGHLCYYVLNED
ncbi:hypothetical protein CROQUDRAFT_93162 [Cronartium quercuum f. sp. fusiforme G11]|uniref:Uncharacterized protein n=1 Tax=Cronartium quercuum f. sp. fusiforme G11 TaxID=708437 RepID=A0A9P6NHA3_9BASI|nr:hypothetical protein CROQUDRAFT_93162 [Cronartium quercuum f. sp. fusiforme G11]